MIGSHELVLILIVALFLFGPTKLPELAQSLGKAVGEFKRAQIESEHSARRSGENLKDQDIKIHNLAIEMGLDTENKTTEQLVEEIRMKVKTDDGLKLKAAGT